MLSDAHCHPFDLAAVFPAAEAERRRLGVMCAASCTDIKEFEYCEKLSLAAAADGAPALALCFALHPQLPASAVKKSAMRDFNTELALLDTLAAQGRLAAVGETGIDLYNAAYRETEAVQDELFAAHIEIALRYDLPLILHTRRAMHTIFALTAALKKCRALVFHSWPGTAGEGTALLKRGLNAYFSFGAAVRLNHREAMRCCAHFPADRLLTETDAPYQPLRGREFSRWADLPGILDAVCALRREAGAGCSNAAELEKTIEANFHAVFSHCFLL